MNDIGLIEIILAGLGIIAGLILYIWRDHKHEVRSGFANNKEEHREINHGLRRLNSDHEELKGAVKTISRQLPKIE